MDPRIYGPLPGPTGGPGQVNRPSGAGNGPRGTPGSTGTAGPATDFRTIFQKQLDQERLKFSAHAQERLAGRTTRLTEADLAKLDQAVDKAAAKGSRESLILMKDLALVVSVKNRTVITAVDGERMKENVFTNIDSAVII
ncbi:MAG TPA: TIGR02530 family flagellar biosynthesis protein [Bacillota bacterium]|jgi:flagellar operon protein